MADDYSYTHSNGTVNDRAADIKETMSDDIKWTGTKSDDLKVRTYGDVAVVTGQLTLTGSAKATSPGRAGLLRSGLNATGVGRILGAKRRFAAIEIGEITFASTQLRERHTGPWCLSQ